MMNDRAQRIADQLHTGKRRLAMRLNDGELPEGFRDALTTEVRTVLCWRDRLRLLLGAHVITEVVTYCENAPGRVESISEFHLVRARTVRPGTGGIVEASAPQPAEHAREDNHQ